MIVQYVDKNVFFFLSMKKIRIFFISFKAIYYVLDKTPTIIPVIILIYFSCLFVSLM